MKNIKITPYTFQSLKKDVIEGLSKREICAKYDIAPTTYYSVIRFGNYNDFNDYRGKRSKAVISCRKNKKALNLHKRIVDEQIYDKVKALLSLGVTPGQVTKIIGFSRPTVKRIRKMNSWEEYLIDNKAMKDRAQAKRDKLVNMGTVIDYDEPQKESEKIETPILDVLVEIREEIKNLNQTFTTFGKAKGFRLF
jgi:DNA invertase Pin-like site-specific DNA recombinase